VKPNECENVAEKSKRGKILNQGLYQKGEMSALLHGKKKKSMR
jgi:hypothetical protein